jgi:hypothetical protein
MEVIPLSKSINVNLTTIDQMLNGFVSGCHYRQSVRFVVFPHHMIIYMIGVNTLGIVGNIEMIGTGQLMAVEVIDIVVNRSQGCSRGGEKQEREQDAKFSLAHLGPCHFGYLLTGKRLTTNKQLI